MLQSHSADEQDPYERNGGASGLMIARKRLVGSSEFGVIVTDFGLDTPAVEELRETLKTLVIESDQCG